MAITLLLKWLMLMTIARHPGVKSGGVEVAACLLNFLNTKTGQCNPSLQSIANGTGLSRDTVIVNIQDLEATGLLIVKRPIEPGQHAAKGQRLPSNNFSFDFSRAERVQNIPTTPNRKSRPPRKSSKPKYPTTPAEKSDHPQSEITADGSRESRPKLGKEETGNTETGKGNRPAGTDVTVASSATTIFDRGRKSLQANGSDEKQARSMLGLWRKNHGDENLVAALEQALADRKSVV